MEDNEMEKEYIICVKVKKDTVFAKAGGYMFAAVDDCPHGTGYPCWCGEWGCKKFKSIDAAEEWFNSSVSFLLNDFGVDTIDLNSVVILSRQYVYNKEKSLIWR